MVIGLFLDGWAHGAQKPETFFSPWHLILYSGFGAAVAYFMFRGYVLRRPSAPDRLTTAGLIVFVIGALGDGAWHQIFGIEVDLEALLSPTHLALMIGGLLMLSTAYRASATAVPREERADLSVVVTMTLGTAVVLFFLQYVTPFELDWLRPGGNDDTLQHEIYPLATLFVANTVLLGMVFLLVRRWRTPRWTFTLSFAAISALMIALNGRRSAWLNVAAFALTGAVTDVFARRFDVRSNVRLARVLSALVPTVMWGAWFASIHMQFGMRWPAELWTGAIVLAAMEGVGLGLLAFPSRGPSGDPQPQPATQVAQEDLSLRPFIS
jgi:hypothetical protein